MFYNVNIELKQGPFGKDAILVLADSEMEAIEKTNEHFSSFEVPIEILSLKSSVICCFLGNPNACSLYICKMGIIGSNMEHEKKRRMAICAESMKEAITYIEKAFEDISSIKHQLLTERQLKTLEYNEEMSYIDYALEQMTLYDNIYII